MMTERSKQKLKSRRFWITIWAILYVTLIPIVFAICNYDGSWLSGVFTLIAGVPVSYVTFSTLKKKKEGE